MTVQTQLPLMEGHCAAPEPSAAKPDTSYADSVKHAAIDRVETAHAAWVQLAVDKIRVLVQDTPEFTTDDLWKVLPPVSEPRAIGAAMRRAQNEGLIAPTGHYRMSKSATCHRRPKRMWQRVVASSAAVA